MLSDFSIYSKVCSHNTDSVIDQLMGKTLIRQGNVLFAANTVYTQIARTPHTPTAQISAGASELADYYNVSGVKKLLQNTAGRYGKCKE